MFNLDFAFGFFCGVLAIPCAFAVLVVALAARDFLRELTGG